jgi:hypothetical protein
LEQAGSGGYDFAGTLLIVVDLPSQGTSLSPWMLLHQMQPGSCSSGFAVRKLVVLDLALQIGVKLHLLVEVTLHSFVVVDLVTLVGSANMCR